jgi:outer membrane protein assembly factor BamB
VFYGDDNTISRIVSGHGLFFINTGGTDSSIQLWAVRQNGVGDVTKSHVVWKAKEDVPIESSPVLAGDLLYMVSNRGVLTCMEAKTGKVVWSERLEGRYGASPLYADDRIYLSSKQGKTTVIEPGRRFRVLAVNELDGFLGASIAVAGKSLLLRTKTHLYRIQRK